MTLKTACKLFLIVFGFLVMKTLVTALVGTLLQNHFWWTILLLVVALIVLAIIIIHDLK